MKITGRPIGAQLRRLADHHDPLRIADTADEHWHAIRSALTPIIGALGVSSLYRRSLHLARIEHPWLVNPSAVGPSTDPFDDLRRTLSLRSGSDAADAQITLLQTFNDLLANLIGSSLTERLLGAVWDTPAASRDAEDGT